MFEAKIVRNENDHYVIVSDKENKIRDYFSIRMIQQNQIEYLLDLDVRVVDGQGYYYYNISNMESLEAHYDKRRINYDNIIKLFQDIEQLISTTREYLLEADHFIINPKYIFLTEMHARFFYVEHVKKDLRLQIRSLLIYLMEKVDYNDKKAVNLTYELFQVVNQESCTLEYLFQRLMKDPQKHLEIQNMEEKNLIYHQEPVQEARMPDMEEPSINQIHMQEGPENKKVKKIGAVSIIMTISVITASIAIVFAAYYYGIIFDNSGVKIDYVKLVILLVTLGLGDYILIQRICQKKEKEEKNQTLVQPIMSNQNSISQPVQRNPQLVSRQQQEIEAQDSVAYTTPLRMEEQREQHYMLQAIEKGSYCDLFLYCYPYTIGKSASMADGIINNSNISRKHAKIEQENGIMTICDLNSTNGTYLNNRKIGTGEKAKVQPGDEIRLADVEYMLVRC